MADQYNPISADSNFAPIRVLVTRNGKPQDIAGCDVFVNVRDASQRDLVVVRDGVGQVVANEKGRAEYYFTSEQAAKVRRNATWLVEWKFVDRASKRVLRLKPIPLPVTAKILS